MRIGIVTDATCDLPSEFIKANDIEILPVTLRIEDQVFVDERDFESSMVFYDGGWGSKGHDAESSPFNVEQVHDVFLSKLVQKFDFVFCITVWRERSKIFENCTKAAFAILRDYRKVRADAGIKGPFAMRVIDSNTLGPGIGVVVAEIQKLIREGVPHDIIRQRIGGIVDNTCALLTMNDLSVVRARATKRGEKSIGFGAYVLANALDIKPIMRRYRSENVPIDRVRGYGHAEERLLEIACQQISHRVTSSYAVVSYGGNPAEITSSPGYLKLQQVCALKGVELLTACSSMSLAVNIGQGALTVGFGTDDWQES